MSALANAFIAALMQHLCVDVLAITEVFRDAGSSLNNLLAQLQAFDATWKYDWIKGALRVDDPTDASGLSWSSAQGNYRPEGYALFWKSGNANFTILDAIVSVSEGVRPAEVPQGHKINLVTHGIAFRSVNGRWNVRQGFLADDIYPRIGTRQATVWDRLDFISVLHKDPETPLRNFTRRPAYAILHLNVGDGHMDCPLLWFHAPSEPDRSETATEISGLSRELFVVPRRDGAELAFSYAEAVIAGGDFNVDMPEAPAPVGDEYERFIRDFSDTPHGGAGCELGLRPQGESKTTIRLIGPDGKPITKPNVTDYLGSAIDQCFFRMPAAGPAAAASVVDLISLVKATPDVLKPAIREYGNLFAWVAEHVRNERVGDKQGWINVFGPGPIRPNDAAVYPLIHRWDEFTAGFGATARFGTSRTAAEFIFICISDHLPLLVQLDW